MPRIVRVDPLNPNRDLLRDVGREAANGRLVVYPTDTVYGLGTNPLDSNAVKRVYEVKRRPPNKPLPVLASSIEDVERIAYVTEEALRLGSRYWPGPLTIILRAKPVVPSILTAGTGKVGVRIPNYKVALMLIEEAGGLLVGTSANISGAEPPRTADEAIRQIGYAVDIVVDSGPTPGGVPSTVIDLTTRPPVILRLGPIKVKDIEEALGMKVKL